MLEIFARSYSAKLRHLAAELHRLDRGLKSNPSLDGAALREFREALDNIRLTAWTTAELLNARRSQKDPQAVLSFFTAERLRRFSQMARDLTSDLEQNNATQWLWRAPGGQLEMPVFRTTARPVSDARRIGPSWFRSTRPCKLG